MQNIPLFKSSLPHTEMGGAQDWFTNHSIQKKIQSKGYFHFKVMQREVLKTGSYFNPKDQCLEYTVQVQ